MVNSSHASTSFASLAVCIFSLHDAIAAVWGDGLPCLDPLLPLAVRVWDCGSHTEFERKGLTPQVREAVRGCLHLPHVWHPGPVHTTVVACIAALARCGCSRQLGLPL
jgi:hypothetical protein